MKNNFKDDSYLSTFSPIEIVVNNGNSQNGVRIEDAIHKFRSLVTKEQVMSSLKLHYEYEKPSERKRRKERENIQRARKAAMMASGYGKKSKSKDYQKDDDKIDIES